MADYSAYTLAQLKAEFIAEGAIMEVASNKRNEMAAELKRREVFARAKSRFDTLSAEEKAALRSYLCGAP